MNTVQTFGFDARLAGSAHAGIGRYSEELLKFLVDEKRAQQNNIRWIVWVTSAGQLPWLKPGPLCEVRLTHVRHYTISEQTVWLRELMSAKLDLLFVPHFNVPLGYRRPFVMTLHDLLWHTQNDSRATTLPSWQYLIKRRLYKAVSESAIKRARQVIVPSLTVRSEVERVTGRTSGVEVVPEGVPELYRRFKGEDKRANPVKERAPYCVYTGSLYPHKNLEVVLKALALEPTLRLKIASARSIFVEKFTKEAKKLGVTAQVEWLGYVPDDKLIELYSEAVGLIQPSRSEGFGLTGLEAMAVGCSVIASDIPVFREVYGKHAHFFDLNSVESLAKVWKNLQENPESHSELQAAQDYARHFSWEKMGEKIWKIVLS